MATITDSAFAISAARIHVIRDNNGRFLIPGEQGTSIGVYSSTGQFLKRVGRAGDRPGGFRGIAAILIGSGDSIHVVDGELNRRTVYDPALDRVVRTSPVTQVAADAILLPDDRLLVSARLVPTRRW